MRKATLIVLLAVVGASLGAVVGHASRRRAVVPLPAAEPAASQEPATKPPPIDQPERFTWAQVASEDWRRYVANLRAIGCPERTIADIIEGAVFAAYQAKVNALFNPLAQYWETEEDQKAIADQVREIRAERDSVLAGLGLPNSGGGDPAGLSPEKQQHVADAIKLYPTVSLTMESGPDDWAKLKQDRKARVNYLSQFLTPEELLDYRMTQDGSAHAIARILSSISLSDEEFRKVFAAVDGEDLTSTNGHFNPTVEAKLRQVLGDSRLADFQNQPVPEDSVFNSAMISLHLSPDQIQQLRDLRAAMGTSVYAGADPGYRAAVRGILTNEGDVHNYFSSPSIYCKGFLTPPRR
jgi:hypothetical protein